MRGTMRTLAWANHRHSGGDTGALALVVVVVVVKPVA